MNVALYARYSSDNQRTESIDAQLRYLKDFCKDNKYSIVKIYTDEALSGTSDNRPKFLQMINDAKLQLFDAIIVHKLDRFARNRYDSAFYKREVKKYGVKIISALEKFDDSPESIILESVIEGMNEYYSANLSREVMKGMKETAYECKHTGGKPPFGYDVAENKKYIINEYEASIVKDIFKMYLDGNGYSQIIDSLKGVKTKTGNEFSKSSINNILSNEKYTGTYVFNKYKRVTINGKKKNILNDEKDIIKIEGGIPSIISKEIFNKVSVKREKNKKAFRNYNSKRNYVLSGLVKCGLCGASMVGSSGIEGRNKREYVRYKCNAKKNKRNCKCKDINKDVLDKMVIECIENEITKNIDTLTDNIYEYSKKKNKSSDNDLKIYEKKLKDTDIKINNILKVIMDGNFHASLDQKLTDLEDEKKRLEYNIQKIKLNNDTLVTKQAIKAFLATHQNISSKEFNKQKRIINSFVESVIVYNDHVDINMVVSVSNGGEGSRTPVRKPIHPSISHYSRYFNIPSI